MITEIKIENELKINSFQKLKILSFIISLMLFVPIASSQLDLTTKSNIYTTLEYTLPAGWETTTAMAWRKLYTSNKGNEQIVNVSFPYVDWNDNKKEKFEEYPVTTQWEDHTNLDFGFESYHNINKETFYKNFILNYREASSYEKETVGETKIAGHQAFYVFREEKNLSKTELWGEGPDYHFVAPKFRLFAVYHINLGENEIMEIKIDSQGTYSFWTTDEGEELKVVDNKDTRKEKLRALMDKQYTSARTKSRADITNIIRSFKFVGGKKKIESTISGKISVPDINKKYGKTSFPLNGVSISLLHNNEVIANTSSNDQGTYELQSGTNIKDLVLRVDLSNKSIKPALFSVVFKDEVEPIQIYSLPFTINEGEEKVLKDIELRNSTSIKVNPKYASNISDLGLIYVFVNRAHDQAINIFNIKPDFNLPLEIRAFKDEYADPQWLGPCSDGTNAGKDPNLILPVAFSQSSKFLTADMIAHEIGHAMMADVFGNLYPFNSSDINHGGYLNKTTCDSWGEGFATFFAAITERDQDITKYPQLVDLGGFKVDIEVNYRATTGALTGGTIHTKEEYAVAGLLWDLVDPISRKDITTMEYDPALVFEDIEFNKPAVKTTAVDYYDEIQLDFNKFWKIISTPTSTKAKDQKFKYIYDIRQLYEQLKKNNVGNHKTTKGIPALDEVFISHGFYDDINPQNFCYDKGELVGYSGSLDLKWYKKELGNRSGRRSPQPLDDSYILYSAPAGNSPRRLIVSVEYYPPYEAYNTTFEAYPITPGKLHFFPSDESYPVEFKIKPLNAEDNIQPIVIDNQEWWAKRRKGEVGSFISHEFGEINNTKEMVLNHTEHIVADGESMADSEYIAIERDYNITAEKDWNLNLIPLGLLILGLVLFIFKRRNFALSIILMAVIGFTFLNISDLSLLFEQSSVSETVDELYAFEGEWIEPTGQIERTSKQVIFNVFQENTKLMGNSASGNISFSLIPTSANEFQGVLIDHGVNTPIRVVYEKNKNMLIFVLTLPSSMEVEFHLIKQIE